MPSALKTCTYVCLKRVHVCCVWLAGDQAFTLAMMGTHKLRICVEQVCV